MSSSPFLCRSLVLCLLCVLSACSVKTVYNNMDTLIVGYVDDMFTLDDPLEAEVRDRASALIEWHRSDQLDDYADLLRDMQQDFGPDITVATIEARTDTLRSFWYALKVRLDEDMVEVLSQLDEEQRAELYASLEDRNQEYREEYVDIDEAERLESFVENMTDTYEDWLGDLSDRQLRLIEPAAGRLRSSALGRVQAREAWHENVSNILESSAAGAEKRLALKRYLTGFDTSEAEGVRGTFENNRAVIARLTRDIVVLADNDQRDHFIEKTAEYIAIFEELRDGR